MTNGDLYILIIKVRKENNTMGAQGFINRGEGASAQEVFKQLKQKNIKEHGNSAYNGTISTCDFGECKKKFAVWNEDNEILARDFVEKMGYGEKWVADYIDLGVAYYIVREVKKTVNEYTAKAKQMYVVYNEYQEEIGRKPDKTSANNLALKTVLKTGKKCKVVKETVIVEGNATVSEFILSEKRVSKKPVCKSTDKKTIIPIHKYLFYGWASC